MRYIYMLVRVPQSNKKSMWENQNAK